MRLRTLARTATALAATGLAGTIALSGTMPATAGAATDSSAASPVVSAAFSAPALRAPSADLGNQAGQAGAETAARNTAPVVNSVMLPKQAAITSYGSIPVLLDVSVPAGMEISGIYAQMNVDGVPGEEWELVSTGPTEAEYEKGLFPYRSADYGIGEATITAVKVRYYPTPDSAFQETEQAVVSNSMVVKQAVNMTGSVFRYSGSRASEFTVTASYYDVAKQEFRDAKGFEVQVHQQVTKKKNGKTKKVWVKVASATLNSEGQASKDFNAVSTAKSLYRLTYAGTSEIMKVSLKTTDKI